MRRVIRLERRTPFNLALMMVIAARPRRHTPRKPLLYLCGVCEVIVKSGRISIIGRRIASALVGDDSNALGAARLIEKLSPAALDTQIARACIYETFLVAQRSPLVSPQSGETLLPLICHRRLLTAKWRRRSTLHSREFSSVHFAFYVAPFFSDKSDEMSAYSAHNMQNKQFFLFCLKKKNHLIYFDAQNWASCCNQ